MHNFSDAKNDSWTIDLTVELIDRIKAAVDADFLEPIEGNPSPITRFYTDMRFKVAVIYTACEEQIKQRALRPKEFAARLDGPVIRKAHDTFIKELKDFFRCLGRLEIVEAVEGAQTIVVRTMTLAGKRLKTAVGSRATLDRAINQELKKLDKIGVSSTASRRSSASTPRRSP